MAVVVFYEKNGCVNNTRQKKMLAEAGHEVVAKDILTTPWTPEVLLRFFQTRPVAEWFNRSAPRITSGELDPDVLGRDEALGLMVAEPLLIRRPLLVVGDERKIGFDIKEIHAWIGLRQEDVGVPDVETCPRTGRSVCD